jgi:hypothetical protein
MRKQKLHFDNLDEVLAASPSSRSKGTQQFETPREQAEALMLPLNPVRETVFDPQCGHGALLRAAGLTGSGSHHLLGIDIDPTASIPTYPARIKPSSSVIAGDFTKLLPMLLAVKAKFDLIVANPPFSLKWKMAPFQFQTVNGRTEVDMQAQPGPVLAIDSTLATFEAAHALLTKRGEGMLICNAVTCAPLLESHALWNKTWLKLTVPNFFPGVVQSMKIAVIYFAASHKGGPLELTAPDAMPATIERTLEFARANRHKLIEGWTVQKPHDCFNSAGRFEAVGMEWQRLTDKKFADMNGWNIRLTLRGTITTYLTPFQSLTGEVPAALVDALKKIEAQHPAALVVQRASRKALVLAVQGGIWRVHPEVTAAVATALREYNAVRAPLRPLNPVQRLGHLDEEDEIRCDTAPGLGFTAGRTYKMETETIAGRKVEKRPHWRASKKGETEDVLVTGQELLIRIKDDNGQWHGFTQYTLGDDQEKERPEAHFHLLSELVECFHIPPVPDVAELHADEFAMYRARLVALQAG